MSARDILNSNLTLKPEYLFFASGSATLNNTSAVTVTQAGVAVGDLVIANLNVITGTNGSAPFTVYPTADTLTFTGTGAVQTSTVTWAVYKLAN